MGNSMSYGLMLGLTLFKDAVWCGNVTSVVQEAAQLTGTNLLMSFAKDIPFGTAIVGGMKTGAMAYSLSTINLNVSFYKSLPAPLNFVGWCLDSVKDYAVGIISQVSAISWSQFIAICSAVGVIVQQSSPKTIKYYETKFYTFKLLHKFCSPCPTNDSG